MLTFKRALRNISRASSSNVQPATCVVLYTEPASFFLSFILFVFWWFVCCLVGVFFWATGREDQIFNVNKSGSFAIILKG